MGKNYYTQMWRNTLPDIIRLMKQGGGELQLLKQDFEATEGNRDSYGFRLDIDNADIPTKKGSAVARDLKDVLDAGANFRDLAKGKKWVIRMGKDFILEVFESVM